MKKNYLIYSVILIAVLIVIYGIFKISASSNVGSVGSAHRHADFKLYINGEAVDFSQPKYQLKSSYVHFEGGDGDVIHTHATGVTIGFFLQTLGIRLDENCITVNEKSCNDDERTLKLFVNGKRTSNPRDHEIGNLGKILVSYGNESDEQIQMQINSVTNFSVKSSR